MSSNIEAVRPPFFFWGGGVEGGEDSLAYERGVEIISIREGGGDSLCMTS